MGMTTIMFKSAEPFEQIFNTLLVKTGPVVSEKTFKYYTTLYMYIADEHILL